VSIKNRFFILFFLCIFCTGLSAQSVAVEIENLLAMDAVTYAQASRFVLDASEKMVTYNPQEAFRYAAERGWLPSKVSADQTARLDDISLLILNAFDINGGLFFSIVNNSHYAYRELVYLNHIQGRADPAMVVSGERLLFIISRVLTNQDKSNNSLAAERAREDAARREAELAAMNEAARREAELVAMNEAARREAELAAMNEAARREAELAALNEAARREAELAAMNEAARREAELAAMNEAARREAELAAMNEAARREAELAAMNEAARREAELAAMNEAARREAELAAMNEAARREAELAAMNEAARREAELAAMNEAARREAELVALNEAARREAELAAMNEAARREAELAAMNEAARREAELAAMNEAARRKAELAALNEAARLEAQLAAQREELARRELAASVNRQDIKMLEILFTANSTTLRDSEKAKLREVAAILKNMPGVKLRISGYTAHAGTRAGRIRISLGRAQSVADYLISLGVVNAANITAIGYGSERPVESNATSRGMAANRRVEITILPEN
jgi:outer membrane protein OmpA-like peptidoglycan-associated protein